MKLSLLNIQRLLFVFLAVLAFSLTRFYIREKDRFQTTLIGVIDETKKTGEHSYLIRFKGTPKYNVLSKIKTDEELMKGDSIYKPIFSDEIFIYRKNQKNKYELFLKI